MFHTNLTINDIGFLLQGAGVTLLITFWAMLGGTILGIIFGVFRATVPWWLSAPLAFLLDIFRSVPLLIQLVLVNAFQSIAGLNASAFLVSCGTSIVLPTKFASPL